MGTDTPGHAGTAPQDPPARPAARAADQQPASQQPAGLAADGLASDDALAGDPLPEALGLAQAAAQEGLGLKLLGGLAVRVVCPGFPPRLRGGQDMDFACLSKGRREVAAFLDRNGCAPDRRFNALNGDRQMYFTAPSGRPVDVMVDRLDMCHTLDFRPSFGVLPFTLDVVDLLLSKLQIVELNEKDARDLLQLLAGVPLPGDPPPQPGAQNDQPAPAQPAPAQPAPAQPAPAQPVPVQPGQVIDTGRFGKILGADWGWWRTVTGNLAKLPALAAQQPQLLPPGPHYDPLAACQRLLDLASAAPKTVKWRLRANVGDRVRWYELPEEVGH